MTKAQLTEELNKVRAQLKAVLSAAQGVKRGYYAMPLPAHVSAADLRHALQDRLIDYLMDDLGSAEEAEYYSAGDWESGVKSASSVSVVDIDAYDEEFPGIGPILVDWHYDDYNGFIVGQIWLGVKVSA